MKNNNTIEVDYITPDMKKVFGVSKYQQEIQKRLKKNVRFNMIEYKLSKIKGFNIINRYFIFPRQARKKIKNNNIKHFSFHLAYILNFLKSKKTIVTCYDLAKAYKSLQWKLFMKTNIAGMKKADRIITISEFSKDAIIKETGCNKEKIIVIYEGVDHEKYKPIPKDEKLIKKYNLPKDKKIILNVGSEQKRKNLVTLIKAFYGLKKKRKDVVLIKVGRPEWKKGRKNLLDSIKKYNLKNDVIIIDYLPEEDLIKFYNLADVYVSPTAYEGGFALPILEAMACGCPVITSNILPLIETVENAGIMVNTYDAKKLAKSMLKVLTDENLKREMVERGIKRAQKFTWERAADQTLKVYKEIQNTNK